MLSGAKFTDSEQNTYDSLILNGLEDNRLEYEYIEKLTNSGVITKSFLQKLEKPLLCKLLYSLAKSGLGESVIKEMYDLNLLTTEVLNSKQDDPDGPKGATALYAAARNGHVEVVKYLLSMGADPNLATTKNAISPLHTAVAHGHPKVVEALLEKPGVNPYQVNVLGQTVFDYLSSIKNEEKRIEMENALRLEKALDDKDFLCPMQGQQWLTLFMLALNYPGGSGGGQCFGIANMSADALLTENGFANLNQKLKDMYKINGATLRNSLQHNLMI